MEYNIHPIFVHFPIALLFVYSILKLIPLEKWLPRVSWTHIKRVLLVFGVLGAFSALFTGEIAEELVRPNHNLVEAHSAFATVATWLYVALLLGELASIINKNFPEKIGRYPAIKKLSIFLEKILCHKIFSPLIALVALIALAVAGLLGGVMVYGISADPLAQVVLNLLGIQL